MRNEIRMYLSELLLNLILTVIPKNANGMRLAKAIKKYAENELNISNG